MKISVAMCTYNGERYIEQQLKSIVTQYYPIDEIQIADDGSTDNTVSIINDFKKIYKNINLTINERNLGPTKNFENVIQRCNGEYICLSDQDDIWHPDKLKIILPILEHNKKVEACFTNADFIDSDGIKIEGSLWESFGLKQNNECLINTERLYECLMRFGNVVTGATIVLKSRCVSKLVPFSPRYSNELHDLIIARKLAINKEIIPIDEPLINYRVHKSQFSGIPNKKFWDKYFFIKKKFLSKDYKSIGYRAALSSAWSYYKNSINELIYNDSTVNHSIKKHLEEAEEEWINIKKRSWSVYNKIHISDSEKFEFSDGEESICFFVAYSETELEEIDIRYIKELQRHFDKVVVLINYLPKQQYQDLEYLYVENKGYDFGFLYQALNKINLSNCYFLAFVNNSNILVKDKTLDDFFKWCYSNTSSFCGITDSYEAPPGVDIDYSYHLQSHFLIFKRKAIVYLKNFFSEINFEQYFLIQNSKVLREIIIKKCEIGLSQFMIRNGVKPASWFHVNDFNEKNLISTNIHLSFWDELIDNGYPLIKKKIVSGEWDQFISNKYNINDVY
jgi:glycosyltransferase involved in cell wall biosynthesis